MRTLFALLLLPSFAAAAPDFARDVRPILANHCFKCHGPDDKARKAKLRLDTREAAATALGTAADSDVLTRVLTDDEDAVMPPRHVKKPLSDKQKQILKEWIAAGAEYAPHWAFVPPRKSEIRSTKSETNPIDFFVRERLAKEGLTPSPAADKARLIRRVSLDLIGLPPTPEEVDAFVKDPSPQAFEKVVDRLLASPHYGERWARKWLDLARYADTNGYEKDRPRTIWPYRDWVIKALIADMPFDQFTVEQIAGDLLPKATPEQRIATGFHRNTMLNEEGGIDPLEFRYYAVVDRVNTTATTWLGLTLGCAQCHTHKFDPIPHADYFRMLAFLNNTEEPDYEVVTPELAKQQAEFEKKVGELEQKLAVKLQTPEWQAKFAAWRAAERKLAQRWDVLRPAKTEAGPTRLKQLDDGSLLALGDPTKADVYALTFADWPANVTAIRLEALTHDSLPVTGPGRAFYEGPPGDFLLSDIRLSLDGTAAAFADASDSFAGAKSAARQAFDDNLQTGWPGRGPGQTSHAVFTFAKPLAAAKAAALSLRFERHYSASLGRFRVSVTTAEKPVARDLSPDAEALLLTPDDKLTPKQTEALLREFVRVHPELKAHRDEVAAIRKQAPHGPRTLVMAERPAEFPRKTFRHNRGEFLQPAEEVQPAGLGILHPLPPQAKHDRLTFAKWLVARDNPLVARVTVNRAWAAFFGRGLVRTVDDFGYQGDLPTHPELLDWLAVTFMDDGWSLKKLHRRIVTSATYQQSSKVRPEHLAKDAENKLLARFPRVRLEAEQLRDAALKASGLLSAKVGGPSVFPVQPAGVQDIAYGGAKWTPSAGEDRHRRTLYTYTKRTAPFALTTTFDGPSGEACLAKREVSNTSLQALTLLNDPTFQEAAQALGQATAKDAGDTKAKLDRVFRRCLARSPSDNEVSLLTKFHDGVTGDEAAKWTAVVRAVMNLDEFVTKE